MPLRRSMRVRPVPLSVAAALVAVPLLVSGGGKIAAAAPRAAVAAADIVPDEIVVDFRDGTSKAQVDAEDKSWGIDLEFNSIEGTTDGVTLSHGALPADVDALLAKIRADTNVEHAEPLYRYHADFVPNDPRYPEQWNLKMIHAPEAWDIANGKGVVVAVIDSGIAYENFEKFRLVPDLDGGKFAPGWNFVNDSAHANDDQGHGTHVAGTIAQVTNNKEGVAGIAWGATLMPIKVLDEFGAGNSADLADAIRWATDHGANVINMSLGGGARSEVMESAVRYALAKGVVIVAAAGNAGERCSAECTVEFPGAYDGVIAVSAVGPDGSLAPYSSWGKELGIAAPGGNKSHGDAGGILQATIDSESVGEHGYEWYQGTSMATPHVAGVAALLISAGAHGPAEVAAALYAGAAKKDDSLRFGHGLLDAKGALDALAAGTAVAGASAAATGADSMRVVLWRAAMMGLLGVFLVRSLAAKDAARGALSPGFVVGALAAGAGFFFLGSFGLAEIPIAGRVISLVTRPIPDWGHTLLGGAATPIAYSVAIPMALAFFGLPFRALHRFVAGLAFGFSAFLFHAAFTGGAAMSWLPHLAVIPWLVVNGALGWMLARQVLVFRAAPERAR